MRFIKICKMTQQKLKGWLSRELKQYYDNVIVEDGFIYVKGKDKVGLTAHLDTVHKRTPKVIEDKDGIISSPDGIGGDDRCGVYMILEILKRTELRPTIIFCEDEEVGGKGSQRFCHSKYITDLSQLLFLIELDRANANDLVFYDDINYEFQEFCRKTTGYKKANGSFSDISFLCPSAGVSGVNISCGYYNAHHTDEFVVIREMEASIDKTIQLITTGIAEAVQYEYVDGFKNGYGGFGGYYGEGFVNVIFYDKDGNEYMYMNEDSEISAIGSLMIENPELRWMDIVDWEMF